MKDLLAASRYAQALFEIARLTHQDEEIEAELDTFSAALKKSPEFEGFFKNPQLDLEQKKKIFLRSSNPLHYRSQATNYKTQKSISFSCCLLFLKLVFFSLPT